VPLDLGPRTLLYLVVDSATPEQFHAYGDLVLPLTPAEVAALPAGIDTLTIAGITIPGLKRTVNDRLEWLIRPLPDPIVTMFNALPGQLGWVDTAGRDTWANIGLELLNRGVPPADLIVGYPALYNGAVANYKAQHGIP